MEAKFYKISFHQGGNIKTLWEIFIPQISIAINEDGECQRCNIERVHSLNDHLINIEVSDDFVATIKDFMSIKEKLTQKVDEEFWDLKKEHGT